MTGDEVAGAIREFVERMGALDVPAGKQPSVEVEVRLADGWTTFDLTPEVAHAFAAALRAYHDPRDQGRCESCGGVRLDDNLICVDCGRAHGILGQVLMERAARQDRD